MLYPGLALTLGLAPLFGWLSERQVPLPQLRWGASLRRLDGWAAAASVGLAGLGLALLPWPLHPAAGWHWVGHPLALWAALEGAFLLPALPGLLSPVPLGARAAARAAQMSLAGRCVIWLVLGTALWGGAGWAAADLPGRLLLGLAGLLALPAAIGAGPFGPERSLSAGGAEAGLDEPAAGLVRLARSVRGAALLAALGVALLPAINGQAMPPALAGRAGSQIQPAIGLAIVALLFAALALALRQLGGVLPRLTLPAALRWCWLRALPLALAGLLYLAVM